METKRTIDTILVKLREIVETKKPITAEEWVDAALFLEILKGDENEKLLQLNMALAKKRLELRRAHKTATDAEIELKTTQEYENYERQRLRIENIKELVRLGKKQAEVRKY